jgi:hydrogenase nickel incorporation protein HypA/HybF
MHEMSIAQSLIKIVLETAENNNAKTINSIDVEVGALSGVVADALDFGFTAVSKGTLAENAEFRIKHIVARATCESCGFVFDARQMVEKCPRCGEMVFQIDGGRELRVTAINID